MPTTPKVGVIYWSTHIDRGAGNFYVTEAVNKSLSELEDQGFTVLAYQHLDRRVSHNPDHEWIDFVVTVQKK